MTVTPQRLQHEMRRDGFACTASQAAMFLGWWVKAGLLEEPAPGVFVATAAGEAYFAEIRQGMLVETAA